MPRVVHFELTADNLERICNFYRNVFGWEIVKWEGPVEYYIVNTGSESRPGINGGIMQRTSPESSTINTINVDDIDAYLKKIQGNGGIILTEKTVVPGVGYRAYCKDTEGNIFGIIQDDPKAGNS